jgi:hypothetical protein
MNCIRPPKAEEFHYLMGKADIRVAGTAEAAEACRARRAQAGDVTGGTRANCCKVRAAKLFAAAAPILLVPRAALRNIF